GRDHAPQRVGLRGAGGHTPGPVRAGVRVVYSLTSYDLWKTTPPDDDGEAWEQYEDRYLATATHLLVAHLTESLPSALTPRGRAAIVAQVRALVDGLDAETCIEWAHELAADDVPSFETWAHPERPG